MSSGMSGSVAVVTGGSGIVGSGIIHSFLQRGCRVIAPCRSAKAVEALTKEIDEPLQSNLTVSIVDVSDEVACKDLAQTVRDEHGSVDHVICCVGGFQQPGELSQQTGAQLRKYMEIYAVPQLHMYAAFLPILKDEESSSYTFITGSLGGSYMPGVSLLTACVSCIFGMSIAARGECESKKLRVNEFRLAARVEKHTDCLDSKQGSHDCRTNGTLVADLAQSRKRGEVMHVSDQDLHDAASKVDIGALDAAGIC